MGGGTGGYAGESQQFPCKCTVLFPLKEGEQTIVMSFNDITMFPLASGRGYIIKACTSLRAVIWVFGTECFGQLLGGHQPYTLAVSVPLME